jgi:heat shock protein HslJ
MTRLRIRLPAAALLAAALSWGCSTPQPVRPTMPSLTDTAWTLARPTGGAAPAGPWPTLRFDAGRASGSDGCNRFSASFTAADGTLQLGQSIGTQMACPDDTMDKARAFDDVLARTRAYRIDGGRLLLLDAAGSALASFDPQASGLAGTAWTATAYNNGRQAVVGPLAGTQLSVQFPADGKLSGFAGCNAFSGGYRLEGGKLAIGPLATTRKACAQPEGVMAQEAAFLRALESAATSRREADGLELRTADDALAAMMTLAPAAAP